MTIFFCLIPLGRRDGILNPILNTINRVEYKVNESHLGNENFSLVQENLGKEGKSAETSSAPLVLILGLLNVLHRVSGCLKKTRNFLDSEFGMMNWN